MDDHKTFKLDGIVQKIDVFLTDFEFVDTLLIRLSLDSLGGLMTSWCKDILTRNQKYKAVVWLLSVVVSVEEFYDF